MAHKSEIFPVTGTHDLAPPFELRGYQRRDFVEIGLVFIFIMGAVWTPIGFANSTFVSLAVVSVLAFAGRSRWTASEMGLTRLDAGALEIVAMGVACCGVIVVLGDLLRFAGNGYYLNWVQAGGYAIWSMAQEFILQAVFFLRFESLFDSRRAVFASATLFAIAHLPSPILTVLSFLGGLIFCEVFRRWRNLYPIGLIHAALGLTIAASFPDRWMHHMRVGIGYLTFHH